MLPLDNHEDARLEFATQWVSKRFDREVVDRVWRRAEAVGGNDPELWRKDEFGAWIHRMAYGDRRSEFGWEIVDLSLSLGQAGIASLRPAQWQNYLDLVAARTQSRITASGLRNTRRLL